MKIRCLTIGNCRGENPDVNVENGKRELDRWPLADCRGKKCRARTGLLIVGYYNTPAYFASGLPDLDDLLKRISFPDSEPLPIAALQREIKQEPPAAPSAVPPPEADGADAEATKTPAPPP